MKLYVCAFCMLVSETAFAQFNAIHQDNASIMPNNPVITSQDKGLMTDYLIQNNDDSIISVKTHDVLDMNWASVLEFADPATRPEAIILPGFAKYPIENLEIKLRLLSIDF